MEFSEPERPERKPIRVGPVYTSLNPHPSMDPDLLAIIAEHWPEDGQRQRKTVESTLAAAEVVDHFK